MNPKTTLTVTAEGDIATCAKDLPGEECGYKAGAKMCGRCGAVPTEAEADDDDADDTEKCMDAPADEDPRFAARARRRSSLGVKSAEFDDTSFLCGTERKMLPGGSQPCAGCTGGCAPEGNFPTLLEIEGLAEAEFDGKVLDAGYSYRHDMFLVQAERKDGRVVEVVYDGGTSEMISWQILPDDLLGEKSLTEPARIIGSDEAAEIASKSIEGEVIGVEADRLTLDNGTTVDAWVVEITGIDGKSFDAYIGLDGEMLAYDEYDLVDDDEDDTVAEVSLKTDDDTDDTDDTVDADVATEIVEVKDDAEDLIETDAEDLIEPEVKADADNDIDVAIDADALWASVAEFEMLVAESDLNG